MQAKLETGPGRLGEVIMPMAFGLSKAIDKDAGAARSTEATPRRHLMDAADAFLRQHWFIRFMLLTLPAYWFLFLEVAGQDAGLVTPEGGLTRLTAWIFYALLALSFATSGIRAYAEKRGASEVERELQASLSLSSRELAIYQRLVSTSNADNQETLNRIRDHVDLEMTFPEGERPSVAVDPLRQLKLLIREARICLSELFEIPREQIGLSIVSRSSLIPDWRMLYEIGTINDLNVAVLPQCKKTAFAQLMALSQDESRGLGAVVFYPSKEDAIVKGLYKPSNRDEQTQRAGRPMGSIICADCSVAGQRFNIGAVLSVSTYGAPICGLDDSFTVYKIENHIVPFLVGRIRIEIALLFLKQELSAFRKSREALERLESVPG